MHTHSDITIRSAKPSDAVALSATAARLFRQAYSGKMPTADLEACIDEDFGADQQRAELRDPQVTSMLAECNGDFVGYLQVRRKPIPAAAGTGVNCELWRIYIDESCRGLGTGRLLLDRVRDIAQTLSSQQVWLGVWEKNTPAITFYRKHGFEIVGQQAFHLGNEVHKDLVMLGSIDAF